MVAIEEYPPLELGHLRPRAQAVARLPDGERVARIRADRWIGYPRALEALARLEALYEWPTGQRMPNLLLIGPTNNGKSMVIEKFRRGHPPSSGAEEEQIPVLAVQMPSDPSVSRFYAALLAAVGAPLRPRQQVAELERLALSLLRRVGVRMLVIDELHNVLAGRDQSRREFLNLLRFLGNELRIPLVGVGTREAYLAIRSDDQLENRFEPISLPLWDEGPDTVSLLASFASSFPLRRASPIATDEAARYLLARSEGTIGELARRRGCLTASRRIPPALTPMYASSRCCSSPANDPSTAPARGWVGFTVIVFSAPARGAWRTRTGRACC